MDGNGTFAGSPWTCDHGDTARSKYTVNAGLPKDLNEETKVFIKKCTSKHVHLVQWIYSRKKSEIYGFQPWLIPGSKMEDGSKIIFGKGCSLVKLNAETLECIQIYEFPFNIYIGGLLMHENGDVYVGNGGIVYRFENGDLTKVTLRKLYQDMGGNRWATQSNGLLVTNDGYLVIKAWTLTYRDFGILKAFFIMLSGLTLIVFLLINLFFDKKICLALFLVACTYLEVPLPILPWTWNWTLSSAAAEKKLSRIYVLDPITLATIDSHAPIDRVSYGRMAMSPYNGGGNSTNSSSNKNKNKNKNTFLSKSKGDEWLVIPGETLIMRWRIQQGKLTFDEDWSEVYRIPNSSTFAGTGPSISNDIVCYTDNTFPFFKSDSGFKLFMKDLSSYESQKSVEMAPHNPGFMFWSTVVDPVHDAFIVWDIHNGQVMSYDRHTCTLRWKVPFRCYDCVSLAADRNHVYITHHNLEIDDIVEHAREVGIKPNKKIAMKELIVLNSKDGSIIKRIPLGEIAASASIIMPGSNNDIYIGGRFGGIARIYC